MNRIFYAMILVAFVVAAYLTLTDPAVPLSAEARTTLVSEVDAQLAAGTGPDGVATFVVAQLQATGDAANPPTDPVGQIAHSGSLTQPLDRALASALSASDAPLSGASVVRTLEQLGRFTFGEASAIKRFNDGLFDMAKAAVVSIVIPLVGAMAFFLGLMKVAEEAGAMKIIAKLLRPLMVVLFPDVPPNHPAMSAMILNMAANALGLGNAATPFGIKAMQELDSLNPHKGTATNAMCLFLAINTSAISLLPTGVIAIRETLGSTNAAGILPTTLMATILSTTTAILAAKLYQRFTVVEVPAPDGAGELPDLSTEELPTEEISRHSDEEPPAILAEDVLVEGRPVDELPEASAQPQPEPQPEPEASDDDDAYPLWVSGLALLSLLGLVPVTVVYGSVIGPWIVPLMVVGFTSFGAARGVAVYEVFVQGAKEGWEVAVRIIPFLVAILAAVGMLRGSGAIDLFVEAVGGATMAVGLPAEALPMALLRPLSGSGAYGVMMATLEEHGPDSYIGYVVSTLQGSTETTFYVLAVYFGAVQVQRIRHGMAAALTADVMGVVGAVLACSLYFSLNGLW